jgi:hypothetical protein
MWKEQAGSSKLLKQEPKASPTSLKFNDVALAMNAHLEKNVLETKTAGRWDTVRKSKLDAEKGTGNRKGVIWWMPHGTRMEAFCTMSLPENHDCSGAWPSSRR